jgi:PAS domain S-box-containing protein
MELVFGGDQQIDIARAKSILLNLGRNFLSGNRANGANGNHDSDDAVTEVRYQSIVEQTSAIVFQVDIDKGSINAYVNPRIEALLGCSPRKWIEDPMLGYLQLHPDDRDRCSLDAANLFLTGSPLSSTYRVVTSHGGIVWFQCEARMIRHADGRPWFFSGAGFEVSERKRGEDLLRRPHDDLELVVRERTAELDRARLSAETASQAKSNFSPT